MDLDEIEPSGSIISPRNFQGMNTQSDTRITEQASSSLYVRSTDLLFSSSSSSMEPLAAKSTPLRSSSQHSISSSLDTPFVYALEEAIHNSPAVSIRESCLNELENKSEDSVTSPLIALRIENLNIEDQETNPDIYAGKEIRGEDPQHVTSKILAISDGKALTAIPGERRRNASSCEPITTEFLHSDEKHILNLKDVPVEIECVYLPADGIKEVEIEKNLHTVFTIDVQLQSGLEWRIQKRYSDFRDFHEKLRRSNANVRQMYFPKRHVFRNRHQSVIEQRRAELERYLKEILEIRMQIRFPLYKFLDVYMHMESYERRQHRRRKELESEKMKSMLSKDELEDLTQSFRRLCSSKYLYHGSHSSSSSKSDTPRDLADANATKGVEEGNEKDDKTSVNGHTHLRSGSVTAGVASSNVARLKNSSSINAIKERSISSSTDDQTGNEKSNLTAESTLSCEIIISRSAFRRDILGVFPDMPSSFAVRLIKAISDRQGGDVSMDDFLRAIAIAKCGSVDDRLRFIFQMCDLDHSTKIQSCGLTNFLVALYGRHVLEKVAYRQIISEVCDQGRARLTCEAFVEAFKSMPKESDSLEFVLGWMEPFAKTLCEAANPQLLESQEELNPIVQQKILAQESHFDAKEISILQDAFNTYRVSSGGDVVDIDAMANDFALEMSESRFQQIFSSFGMRANGTDIDIFSFVNALSIAGRGTAEEKARFMFQIFASRYGTYHTGDAEDRSESSFHASRVTCVEERLMTRDDLFGMLRLDLAQCSSLEQIILAFLEKIKDEDVGKGAKTLRTLDQKSTFIQSTVITPPLITGGELGSFVDHIMDKYGQNRLMKDAHPVTHETMRTLTVAELKAWCEESSYEMASLRLMREVIFIDLGLSPESKEEELLVSRGIYKAYDPINLIEDDQWYLLSWKFFNQWTHYLGLLSDEEASSGFNKPSNTVETASGDAKSTSLPNNERKYARPRSINNQALIIGEGHEVPHTLKPKGLIKFGVDFVVIPEQLWNALKLWYGGGPEIACKVITLKSGNTVLDIWGDIMKERARKRKKRDLENAIRVDHINGVVASDDSSGEDAISDDEHLPTEQEITKSDMKVYNASAILALPRRMRSGGSVGLSNLGNTCYMNSALQCLCNTQLLAEYFLSGMYLDDINRTNTLGLQGKLAEVYGKLAEDMWCAKQKAISPRHFKKTIGKYNEAFRGNDQQDAQELLSFLLSGLSEDLNRITDKPYIDQPDSDGRYDSDLADEWWRNHLRREVSVIVALFTGQYKSLLTCSECGYKSARFEPFTFLQVPLPEPTHTTVTLLLIASNGTQAMKISVRLGIAATVHDLKLEIIKLCDTELDIHDISTADIKIAEYSGCMILGFKADNRKVSQIRSIDHLMAFQLEPMDPDITQSAKYRRPSGACHASNDDTQNRDISECFMREFYESLQVNTLVEVKLRSHSTEYMPGKIVKCSIIRREDTQKQNFLLQQHVVVQIQYRGFSEDALRVPLANVRPRQPRLLYVPLISRKLKYSAVYFKNPFRPIPFGLPHIVRICPEQTTGLELYQLVYKRVRCFLSKCSPPTNWNSEPQREYSISHIDEVFTNQDSSCGFLLRRVDTKGLADSRAPWLTRSFGYTIPCTDEIVDLVEEESVAVDWNLSIFQDRSVLEKMKHIDDHSSIAKNNAIDKGPVPLSRCLEDFTQQEQISEGYCSSCCKHLEMTKKLDIWRLPPVMVIHLKRFQFTQSYRRKLVSLVEFPIQALDLGPCVAPPIACLQKYPMKKNQNQQVNIKAAEKPVAIEDRTSEKESDTVKTTGLRRIGSLGVKLRRASQEKSNGLAAPTASDASCEHENGMIDGMSASASTAHIPTRSRRGYTNTNLDQSRCLETAYDLYGVVNHQGALGGGHYTAYAKNFRDEQWYYYDDERVRVVEESKIVSPSAYLLFYIRSDMKGVMVKDMYPPNTKGVITEEDINRFVEGDQHRCVTM